MLGQWKVKEIEADSKMTKTNLGQGEILSEKVPFIMRHAITKYHRLDDLNNRNLHKI